MRRQLSGVGESVHIHLSQVLNDAIYEAVVWDKDGACDAANSQYVYLVP